MLSLEHKKKIPNLITLIRFIFVFVLIAIGSYIFIELNSSGSFKKETITFNNLSSNNVMISWIFFLVLFIFATITDFLDGYLARKWKVVSSFGKIMDPIADKMLVLVSLVFLLGMQITFIWLVALLLLREIAISSVRLASKSKSKEISAKWHGKLKTVLQFVGITFAFIFYPFANDYELITDSNLLILNNSIILIFSCVISYLSLFQYIKELLLK